jgi:hypothetical protein
MAAKKNELEKTLDLAGEFVMKQGGTWGHQDWESFLKKAGKAGVALDDEGKRNLGNLLEASKFLYHRAGITPEPKAASKVKTKASAMPKAEGAKKPAKKKAAPKKGAKPD